MHWNDARWEERAPCSQCSESAPVGPVTRTEDGIVCVACQQEDADPMPDSEWRTRKAEEFLTVRCLLGPNVICEK